MRKILLITSLLVVLLLANCRPAATPMPNTPSPSNSPLSPLPSAVPPQIVPGATLNPSPNPLATATAAPSGFNLTATVGPTCPGPQRPGEKCERPYAGDFIVTTPNGTEVARLTTNQDGKATANLPPGRYVISVKTEGRYPMAGPVEVTVSVDGYADVSISLDSGIR